MTDLSLDTTTHDIVFAADHRGASIAFVVGGPLVVQKVKMRLLSIYSEWFLDANFGTPWFEDILVKNPNSALVESIIRNQILTVSGVGSIDELILNYDRKARRLLITSSITVAQEKLRFELSLTPARRAT